jgi:hypothetical protein
VDESNRENQIRKTVTKKTMENNTPEQKSLKQQQDELIIKHLEKFGQNNLFRASLDHFIETGMPSGSFYLSLCEMLSEHASQQNEALQEEKDEQAENWQRSQLTISTLESKNEALQAENKEMQEKCLLYWHYRGSSDDKRLEFYERDIVKLKGEKEALQKRVQEKEKEAVMWYDDTITLQKEVERLKKLLKNVLPMAEDGYTLHKKNGSHQEFLSEDRELLSEINKALHPNP